MQLLIDFFPIIVFFVAYKLAGIYVATVAIIVVMVLQTAAQWIFRRKVSRMLLASTVAVIILGGITLALRNPIFIQWKPTLIYWVFSVAFLATRFFGKQTLTERIMGRSVALAAPLWRQLNWIWTVYFAVLGGVNLYVVYNYSESTWVNFKLYGTLGLTLLMAVGQGFWIASHATPAAKEPENGQSS